MRKVSQCAELARLGSLYVVQSDVVAVLILYGADIYR